MTPGRGGMARGEGEVAADTAGLRHLRAGDRVAGGRAGRQRLGAVACASPVVWTTGRHGLHPPRGMPTGTAAQSALPVVARPGFRVPPVKGTKYSGRKRRGSGRGNCDANILAVAVCISMSAGHWMGIRDGPGWLGRTDACVDGRACDFFHESLARGINPARGFGRLPAYRLD